MASHQGLNQTLPCSVKSHLNHSSFENLGFQTFFNLCIAILNSTLIWRGKFFSPHPYHFAFLFFKADEVLKVADTLMKKNEWEAAHEFYMKARYLYEKQGNKAMEMKAYHSLSDVLYKVRVSFSAGSFNQC